jgi:hypothetical protein
MHKLIKVNEDSFCTVSVQRCISQRILPPVMPILLLFLGGCTTYGSNDFVKEMDAQYQAGQYQAAAQGIESKLSLSDNPVTPQNGELLLHLEAAENWRLDGNYQRSNEHYDAVEQLSKEKDTEGTGKKALDLVSAVVVNDAVRSYQPQPVETILSNYYKAISFWKLGQHDYARVEFNRANARARIAVERYDSQVKEKQEDENKKSQENAQNIIGAQFPNISTWEVYDDFVNPAVAYTNALFLSHSSGVNIGKARDLLVRVRGMVGEHSVIDGDLENIAKYNRLTNGKAKRWVIYESGLSPVLAETRFTIPWVVGGFEDGRKVEAVYTVSVALPKLEDRQNGLNHSKLKLGEKTLELEVLARTDKLLRTEFKKRWPATVSRTIASVITKAVLQKEATEEGGLVGSLTAAIYSAASTSADTRIWHAMPEQWSLASTTAEKEEVLYIPYGAGLMSEVTLPKNENIIVYIKQPTTLARPLVEILKL